MIILSNKDKSVFCRFISFITGTSWNSRSLILPGYICTLTHTFKSKGWFFWGEAVANHNIPHCSRHNNWQILLPRSLETLCPRRLSLYPLLGNHIQGGMKGFLGGAFILVISHYHGSTSKRLEDPPGLAWTEAGGVVMGGNKDRNAQKHLSALNNKALHATQRP